MAILYSYSLYGALAASIALSANVSWLKNNPIPGAYGRWGAFEELNERNNDKLRRLLESAAANKNTVKGSNAQKIGDFMSRVWIRQKLRSREKVSFFPN